MSTIKIKKYGWKPSPPDFRDLHFAPPMSLSVPIKVDLRPQCPPIYDQGNLGSCTSMGVGGLAQFLMMKEKHESFVPSRLFIYYGERVIENSVNEDAGANIRDGMKVVSQLGCPHESTWPYVISQFAKKPPQVAYTDGLKHKISQFSRVDNTNLNTMKACLANGYPIVFGFTVYSSFEYSSTAKTGIVPMPKKNESVLGGHCCLIAGYDDNKNSFIVRNSWGKSWGLEGYCFMPYAYLTNSQLADDFWTASLIA